MTATDSPAMLAAQKRWKHRNRLPYVYRPGLALTPIQQHDRAVARTLALALRRAAGR